MNDKLHNLLNDPNVYFFLIATPKLKNFIVSNEHPHIQKLRTDAKAALLEDKALVLDKQDVYDFVKGTLNEEGKFLFTTGEIRVVGAPEINLKV